MSHLVIFWPKPFFYALGNTPAVCLTSNLPPEQHAVILLLGCGDPRSVLYTISSSTTQELDFTCCDIDFAILARNIVLFTLLAESTSQKQVWSIFYDLYIDDATQSLLASHCRILCEISDWHAGRYGHFLRMCTADTLEKLRGHWKLYAEFYEKPAAEKIKFASRFTAGKDKILKSQEDFYNTTPARNAGPLWDKAWDNVSHLWVDYWTNGTTAKGKKTIETAELSPNPMFAYSGRGEEFTVHYGTNPVLGFPLTARYADLKPSSIPSATDKLHEMMDPSVSCARAQFDAWCAAFKHRINSSAPRLIIRMFAGEALAFCKAIQGGSALYAAPWKLSQLVLDKAMVPAQFNVIDTSNLIDHLGLLNVLLAAVPLLERTPAATLYTETLVTSSDDPAAAFTERLCGDVPLMSIFFGVVPTTFISKFTTVSNCHDALSNSMNDSKQYHERLTWKLPFSCDPVATAALDSIAHKIVIHHDTLAGFLFQVYQKMFWMEDPAALKSLSGTRSIKSANLLHYSRETFAYFLGIVKEKTETEWALTMEKLLGLIRSDYKLLLGMISYQDLLTHLYIQQVYQSPISQQDSNVRDVERRSGPFKDWDVTPSIVCVTLVIPRQAFKPLQESDYGSPVLICEILAGGGCSIFSSFHPVFAKVVNGAVPKGCAFELVEDPAGWNGVSPFIASFWAPSSVLLQATPERTTLKLSVKSTPAAILLAQKIGTDLTLFETKLQNSNVLLSKDRPMTSILGATLKSQTSTSPKIVDDGIHIKPITVTLNPSYSKISLLEIRVDILDPALKAKLLNGATVSTSQPSPCTITLSLDSTTKTISFVYPIDQGQAKLRISRKSSYIEILVPTSDLLATGPHCFPVINNHNKSSVPVVWNIHYIPNLASLPCLDTSDAQRVEWIRSHTGFAFSAAERKLRGSMQLQSTKTLFSNIKESLMVLFQNSAGIGATPSRTFGLTHPEKNTYIYTLIFVTDICLDLSAHTIILDTCILPLTETIVTEAFHDFLAELDGICIIKVNAAEREAWQSLLPAFTERCRTWKHHPSCEYITKGIPVTRECNQTPLCACAAGNSSPAFLENPVWRQMEKYVTRAAIAPLFSVSYLDPVFDSKDQMEVATSDTTVKPIETTSTRCGKCGKIRGDDGKELLMCSRCRKMWYCSAACQKADWRRHKKDCGPATGK